MQALSGAGFAHGGQFSWLRDRANQDRHCPTGVLGYADEHGERPLHAGLADQLRHEHDRFGLRAPQFALADIAP
ncbi:hypothetical protein KOJCDNHJ_00034 [Xanthomonas citri pv. punicae]|nr:hypothetical protein KOJCDNHJ_00034 [Xanthomonas citri pv. punicae]